MSAEVKKVGHTPGEWAVERKSGSTFWLPIVDDQGRYVCAVTERSNRQEAEANADLIAASPDLLRELQAAHDALDALCMAGQMHLVAAAMPKGHGMDTFRAAVFKARGKA